MKKLGQNKYKNEENERKMREQRKNNNKIVITQI